MESSEIRSKFLKFFESRGHKIVPSSSLLPTDPSVLFTTAGMQQFKDYYTGKADAMKDFGSLNTVSIQKCMRTSDIDEVGDESHLTFFEMLGNFSFGRGVGSRRGEGPNEVGTPQKGGNSVGYGKKEAIKYAHEFITKELGLKIDYVSVFGGEGEISADDESEQIWKLIDPIVEVRKSGRADNFWGPAGAEGPCGPTTEIYINGVEIWNIVFNEYYQDVNKQLRPLEIKGVDTGMGLERLTAVIQNKNNIFETDLLEPIINLAPSEMDLRIKRIIADHSRSIAFLIADSIRPSNKEQGYVLRRLIRRIVTYNFISKSDLTLMHDIFAKIVEIYGSYYPELNADTIIYEFDHEKEKFEKTLHQGLKELDKLESINAQSSFRLYESFGLPYEVIKELGKEKASGLTHEGFNEEFRKHQEISRAGAEKKFGSHGIKADSIGSPQEGQDAEEMRKITRLHTATHIIVAALKKVLGQELPQAGADITIERLRFDFAFPRKVTPEELKQAEDIANDIVNKDLPVTFKEVDLQEALDSGAHGVFMHKYPNRVKVYTVADPSNSSGPPFSREICGGPHVSHTGEIGRIKITKEESASGGNRRIRAVLDEI